MRKVQKADGNRRPLLLVGASRDALWGGTRISSLLGREKSRIAELWTLSVREDVNTVISGTDMTLAEYIRREGADTVAPTYSLDQPFPLLLKILDADLPLSVQVHPDDAYASENGGTLGKSEMWYILHAEDDAEILYGMKEGVSAEEFAALVRDGKTLEGVCRRRVRAGECYYIPAGLLHALGGGITVAEIQQNSDTTYRLYDYDRTDANGQKRELHLSHGLRVLRPYGEGELSLSRYERAEATPDAHVLADSAFFRVRLVFEGESVTDEATLYYRALIALSDVEIACGDTVLRVPCGASVFIPAGAGAYTVKGHALIADSDCLFQK